MVSRWVLIATTAAVFWLLMMVVHEGGHVLGALATGGRVTRVVLSPVAMSRTDVSPNPSPGVETWSGPVFGAAFPLLVLGVARMVPRAPLPRRWLTAFAGFCLLANGLYLASGAVLPAGDTQELLRLGVPAFVLAVVGLPAVRGGLWMWHTLGARWGLADVPEGQMWRWVWWSAGLLVVVVAGMLIGGGEG